VLSFSDKKVTKVNVIERQKPQKMTHIYHNFTWLVRRPNLLPTPETLTAVGRTAAYHIDIDIDIFTSWRSTNL